IVHTARFLSDGALFRAESQSSHKKPRPAVKGPGSPPATPRGRARPLRGAPSPGPPAFDLRGLSRPAAVARRGGVGREAPGEAAAVSAGSAGAVRVSPAGLSRSSLCPRAGLPWNARVPRGGSGCRRVCGPGTGRSPGRQHRWWRLPEKITMSLRKQTPSDFLKQIIGRPVVVKLNSGVDYRGVLACLDGYMNIALEQTEEYVNGQLKNKYGDAFIRGNNGNSYSCYCTLENCVLIF
uniref:U6 snRNA-associated Sm-like protein LSm6 n=1 Tax=Taeniopygia guttata TaxID=59729 RepID=A0A674H791_TAEGU